MAKLRVIQGGVRQGDMRALLLVRGVSDQPAVRAHQTHDGRAVPCRSTPVPAAGSAIRTALQRRGVQAFLVECTGLASGTAHRLMVAVGDQGVGADFTTLPDVLPAEGLTVAVASCYYDGYRRDRALQQAIMRRRDGQTPAFHIWGGDNLYLDVPADSVGHHPVDHTLDRYLRYYLESGYGLMRGTTPAFSTYDDHEFWNNYPESVPWLSRSWSQSWRSYGDATRQCLSLFQSQLNPPGPHPACFDFKIDPLSFFFLDLRTARMRRAHGARSMTPQAAIDHLSSWALNLRGPGVLVIGQPLWIPEGDWRDYNPPAYANQYRQIWTALRHAPYDMLVISGDVHHSRVMQISFGGTVNRHVYEFVSSPVCHIPTLAATIGLGKSQDQGSLDDVPGKVPNAGHSLSARYFFGTDAQHTFGTLHFTPLAHGQVRVGARFVNYFPKDVDARAKNIKHLPRMSGTKHEFCHNSKLFTLRMR